MALFNNHSDDKPCIQTFAYNNAMKTDVILSFDNQHFKIEEYCTNWLVLVIFLNNIFLCLGQMVYQTYL